MSVVSSHHPRCQVPEGMRSVCQSINLLCTAFGSLAATGLNSAMAGWIPNDLNAGCLEGVFLVLSGTPATIDPCSAMPAMHMGGCGAACSHSAALLLTCLWVRAPHAQDSWA
jgi:hypothetical protein